MNYWSRQFKQILFITVLLFCTGAVWAQSKTKNSKEYRVFAKSAGKADVSYSLPEGFKELPKPDGGEYDYAIELPGEDFEIWFKVSPEPENAPDSLYLETGKNRAKELAGDNDYYIRNIPEETLNDYNADAGKVFFMNLPDSPQTNHYKYALLTMLQKSKKGTITAVCITNYRGPDLYKNINKARNCIKFKVE